MPSKALNRPELSVGDQVRVEVKPIDGRGSYRVTESLERKSPHNI